MIYPRKHQISKLEIPEELKEEPYFLDHNLVPPLAPKKSVTEQDLVITLGRLILKEKILTE